MRQNTQLAFEIPAVISVFSTSVHNWTQEHKQQDKHAVCTITLFHNTQLVALYSAPIFLFCMLCDDDAATATATECVHVIPAHS